MSGAASGSARRSWSDRDVDAVEAAADVVRRIEDVVGSRVRAGRYRSAIAWTRAAASFAATNPTAFLRSRVLEDHVASVATATVLRDKSQRARRSEGSGGRRRVLHVVSETHILGGHRSVLLRWIELDERSSADVYVTRPHGLDAELLRTVARHGGSVKSPEGGDVITRAHHLRHSCAGYDLIVVHAHPDDAMLALALHDLRGDLPPQLMVDHADHVFWLLPGSPALHASVRPAARDVAVRLRGVPESAATWIPIPISLPSADEAVRRDMRTALRVGPDSVLAITVARAVKFRRSHHHPGFLDVVVPAVAATPAVEVIAVGPDPSDPEWIHARAATQGRVRALGSLPDPHPYLAAADLYLDPFPFTSHTSMLEAAAHRLPVLAGSRYTGTASLLGASTLLGGAPVVAATDADYVSALRRLATDAHARHHAAQAAWDVVARQHVGSAWVQRLEEVITQVRVPAAAAHVGSVVRDVEYAAILRGTESRAPLQWILAAAREDLDLPDRVRVAWKTWERRTARWLADGPLPEAAADAHSFLPRSERRAS